MTTRTTYPDDDDPPPYDPTPEEEARDDADRARAYRPRGRPPRADLAAAAKLEIRCTEGERAVLDDVSGETPTSTWARDVLMREAGRILAARNRATPEAP